MYDADTTDLILKAPPLDGLDAADLPRLLTSAYAEIVASRIRIREGHAQEPSAARAEIVSQMRRLALTNEAFVSANLDRENRRNAAFVAASAHHVALMAEGGEESRYSQLSVDFISSEVAATLLFLIAEASADAAEMAKRIKVPQLRTVEAVLLASIKHLANGKLDGIVRSTPPIGEDSYQVDAEGLAVQVLYAHTFGGVAALAHRLLGGQGGQDPEAYFAFVKGLAVEDLSGMLGSSAGSMINIYPGPWHLASLLSAVARDLLGSALVLVPPPIGGNTSTWKRLLEHISKSRPYLWANHRAAIEAGYLEPGTSSAISFPTGSGKSTLSELKIAAAITRGVKTVFLAPTLSLVDQTVKALAKSFPEAEIEAERSDDLELVLDIDSLPPISVMTPERCLAMMSFDRTLFSRIGLLIFDECHLLHPRSTDQSRRAVDAMLCLLNFATIAPGADLLLLSAMMQNAGELAAWIEELTHRRCLALTLNWKPTRQVRGCVVYDARDIQSTRSRVGEAKRTAITKGPPKALRESLKIHPLGLFSLHQTWASRARADYTLLPLLNDEVLLGVDTTRWYLTANANQVSAAIAAAAARQGIRTLVFVQTIPMAVATAEAASRIHSVQVTLTDEEQILYEMALDEIGDDSCLYLRLDRDGKLAAGAVCHHGDLLPSERHLHESLFKRANGVNIMVATSTLAQGMNLPSEIVIISGDSRFDQEVGSLERLEAHELLNAAGRAGRAGNNSHGMVVVVPSKVTEFDTTTNNIGKAWIELQAIFSQSDQCLSIEDPLEALLDQIASNPQENSEMTGYLVTRLPVGDPAAEGGAEGPSRLLLGKSLAAFKARQRGDQTWIDSRTAAAMAFRNKNPSNTGAFTWMDSIAAAMAVPIEMVHSWAGWLATPAPATASITDWVGYMRSWLQEHPHFFSKTLRRGSLESLMGKDYIHLEDDRAQGKHALEVLLPLLELWMAGEPLTKLQAKIPTNRSQKKCEKAREFALKIVPDLAYLFSLPAVVLRGLCKAQGIPDLPPLGLHCLGSCVKEGMGSVEMLAFRQLIKSRGLNRREIHRQFLPLREKIEPFREGEDYSNLIRRIDDLMLFEDV
jgi:superfamily II DNA/RNA helicase